MPEKDQKITIVNDQIHIVREKYNKMALATHTKELFESLNETTWTPNADGYMTSKKYGSLHKHVMVMKYGEEVIREAYEKDFVIDHINNDGFDCLYTNLEIIPRKLNASKGLTYDEERQEYLNILALNFSKDEKTGEYQISIGFNIHFDIQHKGTSIPITGMYLRYGNDYRTTLIDAQSILNDIKINKKFEINKLRASKIVVEPAILVDISSEDAEKGWIEHNGIFYIIQNNKNVIMTQLHHNAELHK